MKVQVDLSAPMVRIWGMTGSWHSPAFLYASRVSALARLLVVGGVAGVAASVWSWFDSAPVLWPSALGVSALVVGILRARRGPDVVLSDEAIWDRQWGLEPVPLSDVTFVNMSISAGAEADDKLIFGLLGHSVQEVSRPQALCVTVHRDAVRPARFGWIERALARLVSARADLPQHILQIMDGLDVTLPNLGQAIEARVKTVTPRPPPPPTAEALGEPEEVMARVLRTQSQERWARVMASLAAIVAVAATVWILDTLEPDFDGSTLAMIISGAAVVTWQATYFVMAPKIA